VANSLSRTNTNAFNRPHKAPELIRAILSRRQHHFVLNISVTLIFIKLFDIIWHAYMKKSFSCYKDVDSQMQWQRSCGSPCKMRKTVAKTVLCWSSSDIYDSNRNIYRKSVIVVRLGPCQQPLLAAVYIVHVYVCLILSRGQRGGGQHIHTRYQFRRDKSPEMQTSLYNGLQTRMHSKKSPPRQTVPCKFLAWAPRCPKMHTFVYRSFDIFS